jgi:PAS domain S-box-containing protein
LNQRWIEYTGLPLDQAVGWGWMKVIHPEDLPALLAYWRSLLAKGEPGETEARLRSFDGTYRWYLFRALPLRNAEGHLAGWYGTNIEIEDRKQAVALLAGEKRILELIAKGHSLGRTLDALCTLVGELCPDTYCSILLIDKCGRRFAHGAAPSLPDSFNQAMDGRAFDTSGGACARAARLGKQIIVTNIAEDPLWGDRRELPLTHGFNACWSTPVFSSESEVLGVFALYSRTPAHPTPQQLLVIEQITDIASIAIERDRAAAALQASERLARGQVSALARTLAALAPESEPDQFLEHVLAVITEQFGAHSCSVWRHEETTGLAAFEYAHDQGTLVSRSHAATGSPALHEVWPWTEVCRTGKPFLLADIRESPPFPWRDPMLALGIISILVVPMLISGDVKGMIGIRFTRQRDFHAGEMELAQALANQAMLAMQLTRLAAQSRESAVVAERNRMARDIHDTLAQGFTGIIVQLDAAGDAKSRGLSREADEHVSRANALARDSLEEARRSVRALRPQALDEKSLVLALEELFRKMTAGTPLQLEFTICGTGRTLPADWDENLLRIGQEVLTNSLRHSGATLFTVSIVFADDTFSMVLQDNGRGFDVTRRCDGFGLTGMRERIESMAGTLQLWSAPGQGTRLEITLNLV